MNLFENIDEINANENNLNFESFKSFSNLTKLMLACNNIKTIRLKHEEFSKLETLDLSFNSLSPNDVAHLGILKNLKVLKLTGNNLTHLPDTFSKLYVFSKE
jgi:Leucine-rich repeat (LRR) protein